VIDRWSAPDRAGTLSRAVSVRASPCSLTICVITAWKSPEALAKSFLLTIMGIDLRLGIIGGGKMRTLLLISLLAATVPGGPDTQDKKAKERTYAASFEVVWTACVQAANENFVIEHSDKDSGILNFHSGMSLTSNGFRVGVTVSKLDDER